jgi:hypothetical protein
MMSTTQHNTVTCQCGAVAFEAQGAAIASTACYCASCQEAGRRIEQLAGAPPVLDADGATAFVLYRKDRVRCVRGGERLEAHRLEPDAPTRRMVASCCNSAMCLDFTKGHWLTLYRGRLAEAPPLEMRVMTADRREGVDLPTDVPNYAGHSGRFMWKLLSAWVAMGFRAPKVAGLPD